MYELLIVVYLHLIPRSFVFPQTYETSEHCHKAIEEHLAPHVNLKKGEGIKFECRIRDWRAA